MGQITNGVRAILSLPWIYSSFQYLMGARSAWPSFVNDYVHPFPGAKLLDIGCGPADILDYLPEIEYWGFDISRTYIDHAIRKFGDSGQFFCKILTEKDLEVLPRFDVVIMCGVLHHLDDAAARQVVSLAKSALRPGGRLVTIDPCFAEEQNPIARLLISQDRGQNVRMRAGYQALVESVFSDVRIDVRHKVWIPYTHCYMDCTRS